MIRDEELQNQVEQKGTAGDGMDASTYRRVFDVLKKEPDFQLPANFADRVVIKIESRKESSRDMIWLCVGFLSLLVAAVVAVALTNFKINFGAFKFISGYPGLIIFGAAFLLVLHWVDKKLIKPSI